MSLQAGKGKTEDVEEEDDSGRRSEKVLPGSETAQQSRLGCTLLFHHCGETFPHKSNKNQLLGRIHPSVSLGN